MLVRLKNRQITNLILPKVTAIGNKFLHYNARLVSFSAPELETIGKYFLYNNRTLVTVTTPKLKSIDPSHLILHSDKESFYKNLPYLYEK